MAPESVDMEITTEEVAELLNRTDSRIRQLCRSGLLPARKVDGRWMVRRSALVSYVALSMPRKVAA